LTVSRTEIPPSLQPTSDLRRQILAIIAANVDGIETPTLIAMLTPADAGIVRKQRMRSQVWSHLKALVAEGKIVPGPLVKRPRDCGQQGVSHKSIRTWRVKGEPANSQ
jgi:hypothetical protein